MNTQRIGDVAEALLEYVENGATFQGDRMVTVPAAHYTDPDRQRAEVDLIFHRLPLMLALSCELPKPGDYKATQVMTQPVLITRNNTGVVRAFLNVCAHRWSPVVREGYGNCTRFTCPFHGWTYHSNGKLVGITDRIKFGDIDKSTHGLRELPCEERYGMIFVCLTSETRPDLDEYYGSLLEEFATWRLDHWTFLGARELECANWKILLTNFFESYHFGTLHAKTLAPTWASNVNHYEGFGPNMRIGFVLKSIKALRDVPREQWGQLENDGGFVFMRFLFPNVTVSFQPVISSFTQIYPGPTPERSRMVILYLSKEAPASEAEREKTEDEINFRYTTLRDEDCANGINTQRGLMSGAHPGLVYGRNECGDQYFHEWVDWYLRADPLLPKPVI